MFWLIKTTIPLIISFFFLVFLNKNYKKFDTSKNFVSYFVVIWIFLFLIQFFILGPYSPINFYDEADIGLSRILHDKNFHLGGSFLHNVQGGSDFYATQLTGGQYISFERLLFNLFPVWIAILIHKFVIVTINLGGCYILLTKAFNAKKIDAIFISSFFSVINPYAVNSTLQHGIGYAFIPLVIYAFLYLTEKRYYFLITIPLSLFIASSTSPVHSFMALYGGLLISFILIKPKIKKNFILSSIFLLVVVIINWSEVLYGFLDYGSISSRVISENNFISIYGLLPHLYGKSDFCIINCDFRYSPTIIILTILFFGFLKKFEINYFKILVFIIFCNYIPTLAQFFIRIFNIEILKAYNFYDFTFFIYIPISILAIKLIQNNKDNILSKFSLIFIFFSISILISQKFDYAKKVLFEPLSTLNSIPNLKKQEWLPNNKFFRTVSTAPYIGFHPNFLWSYGLETLDGYVNLIPHTTTNFWRFGIHKDTSNNTKEGIFGGNLYITNTYDDFEFAKGINFSSDTIYNLNDYIDLNMLRLANTGFIISYFDLKEDGIKKISGPKINQFPISHNKNIKRDVGFFKKAALEKYKNIFKPKEIFIYQIENIYDRIFFPVKIIETKKFLTLPEQFRFISNNYLKNSIYLSKNTEKYQESLSDNNIGLGKGTILNFKKINNGYEAEINVEKSGLLVLNQTYLPKFWNVYVNNKKNPIVRVNNIQMGTVVPNGKSNIKFVYERKLLKQRINELIN